MNSVDEGLFIIHKTGDQYFIGDQQSESVKNISGRYQTVGQEFYRGFTVLFFPE